MMSLAETVRVLGARALPAPDAAAGKGLAGRQFASVSTDSRTLERAALFVALRGERYDGHGFLDVVRERGAMAAMIDEQAAGEMAGPAGGTALPPFLPLIVVDDTRRGLGRLAAHWRTRFDIPLVAVSGSNGKTTVKEMVAAILRAHYGSEATLATQGNLNNDIGLPLTLLGLRPRHACAVIEVGMNHPGETRELAAIAQPTVALVNNAQREHQEFMAGVEEVAREHGALFESLPANGTAVINADDPFAGYWRGLAAGRKVRDFGLANGLATKAAVRARCQPRVFGSDMLLEAPEGRVEFTLQVAGQHNARNAVAAAAAATAAGASLQAVAQGLSTFVLVKGRLQRKSGKGGAVVIDDTYNANPDSVRAAIDVLAQAAPGGQRVLILGDMGEVGTQGPAFHVEVGRYARERGVAQLLAAGELCRHAVDAFGSGARHFERVEELADATRVLDVAGTTLLVKGSRFMRMERVVRLLTGEEA